MYVVMKIVQVVFKADVSYGKIVWFIEHSYYLYAGLLESRKGMTGASPVTTIDA
ncbi:MAG: hypothetical protein NVSMB38_38070 [Ktedonobacteraceae bacterium]